MGPAEVEPFGPWFTRWLKAKGMKKYQVAMTLGGTSPQSVGKWARGQETVPTHLRAPLAKLCGISRRQLDEMCNADPYEFIESQVVAAEAALKQVKGNLSRLRRQDH